MDKLQKVSVIAHRKGIKTSIFPSTRKDKKYMLYVNKKKVHFGQKGYSDYIEHGDKKRRRNFHNRFRNHKGYNDKTSGLYYSRMLLW